MIEHFFQCPYCWQQISVLIDPSIDQQEYVEDCENCCNPISLHVKCQNSLIVNFEAEKLGQ